MIIHFNFKLAFELGFIYLTGISWVLLQIKLNILEVVFVREVSIYPAFPLDSAEEELDSAPLFFLLELV